MSEIVKSSADRVISDEQRTLGEVGYALKRVQWRHFHDANRRMAPYGISYAQWDVLRHLVKRPDASLHVLAGLTFQSDQSMGALTKRMVGRGLLTRVDGPGRAVHHRLTDAGRSAHDAGAEAMAAVLAGTLGLLDLEEQAALRQLLHKALGAE